MMDKYLPALLLTCSGALQAQEPATPAPAHPLVTTPAQTAPVVPGQTPGGNPFVPHVEKQEAPRSAAAAASSPVPPVTEAAMRLQVESEFRRNGVRVGRVNGQTILKLDRYYLFTAATLEDLRPPVAIQPPSFSAASGVLPPPLPKWNAPPSNSGNNPSTAER